MMANPPPTPSKQPDMPRSRSGLSEKALPPPPVTAATAPSNAGASSRRPSLVSKPEPPARTHYTHVSPPPHSPLPSLNNGSSVGGPAPSSASATSVSLSRAMSKNAVEQWLRNTPLSMPAVADNSPPPQPSPAPLSVNTSGGFSPSKPSPQMVSPRDRRPSVPGMSEGLPMHNHGARGIYDAPGKSSPKLGSSPSSQVPSYLLGGGKSVDGSQASDGKKGRRRSIFMSKPEDGDAPLSAGRLTDEPAMEDDTLGHAGSGSPILPPIKKHGRMSAYISSHSPAAKEIANPMDSIPVTDAPPSDHILPAPRTTSAVAPIPHSPVAPAAEASELPFVASPQPTDAPTSPDLVMTEGRQMLGDDYAESSASEHEDIIPPKVLLGERHRQSLVPSLHSAEDSSSEEHRFSFGGDTSTLDGGSSDASDSDMGSISSGTLASASLQERMEIMKLRTKRSKDKFQAFEAARFIVDNVQFLDKAEQKANCELAIKQLKKLSIAGLVEAQYLLANLYISGIPGFQEKHKADYSKAFNLYSSAAKKDHPEALFHVGLCYEQGAGVGQSNNRALHNYRKAAVSNHPGAMFRLGMCLLRGELSQSKNPRDGVKWLKLAAKYATEKYPQALYELALLHDHGVHNVVWPDHEYLIELLTQGAGLGHGGCQFKLGEAFEYGYFGVTVDPGRSVYYYSLAAANGNLEAMFELGGWYLTGASDPNTTFTLIQSDTEAHRWVSLAADGGLPKAMFAMGYFCEMGIGRGNSDGNAQATDGSQQPQQQVPDIPAAIEWYDRAAAQGDAKAAAKLKELRNLPTASAVGQSRKPPVASNSSSPTTGAAAYITTSSPTSASSPRSPTDPATTQPTMTSVPKTAKKDKKKKKGCAIM